MKLHLGEQNLNTKFNFPDTDELRLSLLARFLKFTYLFSIEGAQLSLGEPPLVTVPIREPTPDFDKYGPLSEFAEFFAMTIHKHFPERTPVTSFRALARAYWRQRGMFSLVTSRGSNNLFRIDRIEDLDSKTRRLALFFPATLSFDNYQYGALMKLSSSSLLFNEESIVIRDVNCHVLNEFFSDGTGDVYALTLAAGKTAAASVQERKKHEAIALACRLEDGTYSIIGF